MSLEIVSPDHDAALGRFQHARYHTNGRGLAGTIRSKEPEDFTPGHAEIEAVHGREVPVALHDSGQLEHVRSCVLAWTDTVHQASQLLVDRLVRSVLSPHVLSPSAGVDSTTSILSRPIKRMISTC